MRVVIAPDCFGGTLSAVEAAAAIAAGWGPIADLDLAPMSDGGPGFLEALPGVRHQAVVTGPLGTPVTAGWLLDGVTAYLEAAQACGLHLVGDHADPEAATTRGVGELAATAAAAGAREIVVGLGGSASTDGGAGFVAAWPGGAQLVAATDVDNPLLGPDGAAVVFGPQKGADPETVLRLEARLAALAAGRPEADLPGAGAAGGLGFALLTLGARRVPGAEVVAAVLGLADRVATADLVVTGEGSYDATSLRGKVAAAVTAIAAAHAVPCVVLAGRVEVGRREMAAAGVAEAWDLTAFAGAAALSDPAGSLTRLAARVAGQWRS